MIDFGKTVILFAALTLLAIPADLHEDDPIVESVHEDPKKERPAILGRDDYPSPVGVGRSGIGSDYKPRNRDHKPSESNEHMSESRTIRSRGDEYDRRRPYRDEDYDDYDRRPYRDRDDYDRKPVRDRDDYDRRPYRDRDDYDPKPVRDDYDDKPVRDSYRPAYRPVRRGQLPKPNNDRYDRRPIIRDEYEEEEEPSEFTYRRGDDDKRGGSVSEDDDEYPPPRRGSGNTNNRPTRPKDRNNRPSRPDRDDHAPPIRRGGGDRDHTPPIRRGGGDHAPPIRRGSGHHDSAASGDDDLHSSVGGHAAKKDGKCICVPYYQCKDGHVVTDGGGIIDITSRRHNPNVSDSQLESCGPIHVCCSSPETSTVLPYEHRCGRRNPTGINSRVLAPSNKGEADFGEWPWQAAVLKAEGKVNIFMCGGVLIDKLHVLTVAHCVFHLYQNNEYPLKVRLGEWDTQKTTEFLAHEDYDVAKIIVHPEFRNTSLWNDLAILKLDEPVAFAPHIDTVCLPKYDDNFVDQNCVVTGWGKDAYKGGPFSNVMKEVAIQVIDSHKCEGMLRKTRLGRFYQLYEGFLCAGGEYGLDSCKGDGGGPLMCLSKDKTYALAGIVSWGLECGHVEVPGIYTKIQRYLDWISRTTGVAVVDYWPQEHRLHDHRPKP